MKIHPLIMAGGSGTRFWPLSRKSRPKQFLALASERPLIAETVLRLDGLAKAKDVFVVCGKAHAAQVKKLAKVPAGHIIVEPMARNTAPAIALATARISAVDPQAVIAALPADHHIANPGAFRETLARAAQVADAGYIVTIGLKPTRPETGYGYIQLGDPIEGAHRARAFVEKPDAETARRYLHGGDYLWNGGIFVFRADVMLNAFRKHAPEMVGGLDALVKAAGTKRFAAATAKAFKGWPSISIDYAVAEKAENIAVIPGDFGWSDVGSFGAIPEVRAHDPNGNVVSGNGAIVIDCHNCVVLAGGRPLAVVGLRDVVVADGGDAVLVIPKERSQDVRQVVEALKANPKLAGYL